MIDGAQRTGLGRRDMQDEIDPLARQQIQRQRRERTAGGRMMADPRVAGVAGAHQARGPPDRMDFRRVLGRLDAGFVDITLDMDARADGVDQLQRRLIDRAGHDRPLPALQVHHHLDVSRAGQALTQAAADAEALSDDRFEREDFPHACAPPR